MTSFVDISIPQSIARELAARTDPRTADDHGYAIKSVLAEAFGDGVVRPWRLTGIEDGVFRIVGAVDDVAAVKTTPASRKLGVMVEPLDFDVSEGDLVELSVHATPVKCIRVKATDASPARRIFADVSASRVEGGGMHSYVAARGDDLKMAYARWLVEQMLTDGTGIQPVDIPVIESTRPHRQKRKRNGVVDMIITPCVTARVTVRVEDVGLFLSFVRRGLKKMKDVGFGALIPTEILDEVSA